MVLVLSRSYISGHWTGILLGFYLGVYLFSMDFTKVLPMVLPSFAMPGPAFSRGNPRHFPRYLPVPGAFYRSLPRVLPVFCMRFYQGFT